MGGWALNNIGPQRMPATPARLRAQWRQTDSENRESIAVRRQWMALIGCNSAQIETACVSAFNLNLAEELHQLSAAIRVSR